MLTIASMCFFIEGVKFKINTKYFYILYLFSIILLVRGTSYQAFLSGEEIGLFDPVPIAQYQDIGNGWVAYKDDENRTYYYHVETGETQWDRPQIGVEQVEEMGVEEMEGENNAHDATAAAPAPLTTNFNFSIFFFCSSQAFNNAAAFFNSDDPVFINTANLHGSNIAPAIAIAANLSAICDVIFATFAISLNI